MRYTNTPLRVHVAAYTPQRCMHKPTNPEQKLHNKTNISTLYLISFIFTH